VFCVSQGWCVCPCEYESPCTPDDHPAPRPDLPAPPQRTVPYTVWSKARLEDILRVYGLDARGTKAELAARMQSAAPLEVKMDAPEKPSAAMAEVFLNQLSKLKVKQLEAMLIERRMATKGKRKDLIERLVADFNSTSPAEVMRPQLHPIPDGFCDQSGKFADKSGLKRGGVECNGKFYCIKFSTCLDWMAYVKLLGIPTPNGNGECQLYCRCDRPARRDLETRCNFDRHRLDGLSDNLFKGVIDIEDMFIGVYVIFY
jgi:hypothetical protein